MKRCPRIGSRATPERREPAQTPSPNSSMRWRSAGWGCSPSRWAHPSRSRSPTAIPTGCTIWGWSGRSGRWTARAHARGSTASPGRCSPWRVGHRCCWKGCSGCCDGVSSGTPSGPPSASRGRGSQCPRPSGRPGRTLSTPRDGTRPRSAHPAGTAGVRPRRGRVRLPRAQRGEPAHARTTQPGGRAMSAARTALLPQSQVRQSASHDASGRHPCNGCDRPSSRAPPARATSATRAGRRRAG